jgi:Aspartyl protease
MMLPFEVINGLAVLEAEAAGHAGRFVLDTGCSLTSLDAGWAAERGVTADSQIMAHGSGSVSASLAVTSLRLGDLVIAEQQVVLMPLDVVSKKFSVPIDGIIGFDILSRGIVEIDFRRQIISFSPDAGEKVPQADEGAAVIEVDLAYRIPIASATIVLTAGVELTARMAIDLGSTRIDVRLLGPFVDAHQQQLDALELTPGAFGTGVGGDIDGHLCHFAEVRLGELTIPAPTAAITRSRAGAMGLDLFDGTIGATVFHDRRLILDYARNRVIVAS